MFSSGSQGIFENPAALAALAALVPEPAPAEASGSDHARKAGGRTTKASHGKVVEQKRIGGEFTPTADPAWIKTRLGVLERIAARNAAEMATLDKPAITVTLPNGKTIDGTAWTTTPFEVAASISKGLANDVVIANVRYSKRVAGATAAIAAVDAMEDSPAGSVPCVGGESPVAEWELWDVTRALEGDCELQLIKFDDPRGKEVFWHSSAHVLGEALESLFGAKLTHGPPTEGGFFYDSFLGGNTVTGEMIAALEKKVKQIADEKQPFERVVVTKDECLELFASNPFKVAMISSKLPDGVSTTVYRNGPFVDLCKGPHLPSTGKVKAFAITKNSGALWLGQQGNAGNDELQRVYGISFAEKKQMTEWKTLQEEAAKRDHRKIGEQQELFFFDEVSPGSCFFLPHGCRIYNKMMEIIRKQFYARNYHEIITPNMFNLKLWETSGHAAKYKENMFCFHVEGQEFGLKPMNCPSHCMMFKHRLRSYRELPIRYGDFGVLHRNELSGALTGLTRVRRFQQDDGHIFCMVSQIKKEVADVLDFISTVYSYFGMDFALKLSTRPENALGDKATWDKAEAYMAEALDEFKEKTGRDWSLNEGDGAFYGPKIDVQVFDALKRPHQCATAQLDFVLPQRFDLKYQAPKADGAAAGEGGDKGGEAEGGDAAAASSFERPVMIHRAVLGSVERMFAILTEHYAGKWPFFLSPRQVMIVPVSKAQAEYATQVETKLRLAGFFADADVSSRTLKRMVREAQLAQYNYILVVGADEMANGTVSVRTRDNAQHGVKPLDDMITEFERMTKEHVLDVQLGVVAENS